MHGDNLCRLQTCDGTELHLARGSPVKEETALSWDGWHAESCAVSMALRWCIIFPFGSFLLLLANTRDNAGDADAWRRGKGTFSPPQACFALTCLPLQQHSPGKATLPAATKASSFPLASSKGREGLQHCTSAGSVREYIISHPDMLCLLAPALSRTDDSRHAQNLHSLEAAASLWEMTVFSPPAYLPWVTRKET